MTVEPRAATLSEVRTLVTEAWGKLQVAAHGLEVASSAAERDLITGYAGATALKHLRAAVKEVERARVQLESIKAR